MSIAKVDFIESFKKRTNKFALDAIIIYQRIPKTDEAKILGKQLFNHFFIANK